MTTKHILRATSVACLLAAVGAHAAPVDLSTWTDEEVVGDQGSVTSDWVVQNAPANDAVLQGDNSAPSFFFEPGTNSQGLALSGKIEVLPPDLGFNDDDFIGFVLGYDSGENDSASANFVLIDWKQADQDFGPGNPGLAGLALSLVTDTTGGELDFWTHTGGVTEVARATNLGSTGWVDE